MTKIYQIGNLRRRQCAQRDDGQWFERESRRTPWGVRWTSWYPVHQRPMHSWYDPTAGEARLPRIDHGSET
jgi:hypothetical protein